VIRLILRIILNMKLKFSLLLLLTLVLCVGCSDKVKVSGRITFPDGSPLTTGTVNFSNNTTMARGSVDEKGYYVVSSEGKRDGLKPGSYEVCITQAIGFEAPSENSGQEVAGTPTAHLSAPVQLIDKKFEDTNTSGLKLDVKKSTKFDITVYKPGEVPAAE